MKRLIESKLLAWRDSADRKPLLLFGARQVGKTYTLERFGTGAFDGYVHLDFSRNAAATDIFEGSLEPKRIVSSIEALVSKDIVPRKTLLVLDEVQLCERALTSLKYFCENAPEYPVAAAGRLLGVKLRESGSFPVGKVDMMRMHPLSFEEYLWARGEERLCSLIENCYASLERCPLHEHALDLYREYLLVGGMPDVVRSFVDELPRGTQGAYAAASSKQSEIDQAYIADIAKHAPTSIVPQIIDVWDSIPSQLAKENSKFQYKAVRSGGRASLYKEPIAWLAAAAVISVCTRVSEPLAPLRSFEDKDSFKLYRADTGLLASSYDALPADLAPQNSKGAIFRGALSESYVMQQLAASDVRPFYWGTASKQEVDFIARNRAGDIVPIEVKSGANVRSNSLEAYRKKYSPDAIVRLSAKNFGQDGPFKSIPLYAAFCLAKDLIASPLFV